MADISYDDKREFNRNIIASGRVGSSWSAMYVSDEPWENLKRGDLLRDNTDYLQIRQIYKQSLKVMRVCLNKDGTITDVGLAEEPVPRPVIRDYCMGPPVLFSVLIR